MGLFSNSDNEYNHQCWEMIKTYIGDLRRLCTSADSSVNRFTGRTLDMSTEELKAFVDSINLLENYAGLYIENAHRIIPRKKKDKSREDVLSISSALETVCMLALGESRLDEKARRRFKDGLEIAKKYRD